MARRSSSFAIVALAAAGFCAAPTARAEVGIKVPGTSLVVRPYVETEGGYDSNPDNLIVEPGSSFVKTEGGVKFESDTSGQYYGLTLKVKDVYFENLNIENRWDFRAAFNASIDLTSDQTVKFGSQFVRDFFNLERANIYTSYADYTLRQPEFRFKLEGKNHVEQNLNSEARGNLDQDVFNISKSQAFDFSRTDVKVSLLTFTKSSWLQPFVIYDRASLSYFNQASGASIDRNAQEQYGIAGVRLQFDDRFRIDIGARQNMRDFDDRDFKNFDSVWYDLNVYWQPLDTIKVTAIAERFVEEPGTLFGVADDTRTAGVTFDWQFRPQWKLTTAGYYDRTEAIGDDFRYNKYLATMSIVYEPQEHTEYYLSGLGKWVDEEVTGDSYDRYKIGAGLRYKF
ncbi:MAG: outer membrane beta-barrel protein [Hyphomicrobium sp.]